MAPRAALALAVALLVAGGAYLYAVRGTALMLDLATGMQGLWCF